MSSAVRTGAVVCVAGVLAACAAPDERTSTESYIGSHQRQQTPRNITAQGCGNLALLQIVWPDPSTRIESANWREAGSTVSTQMGPLALPAHCEVNGILKERAGVDGQHYAIRFKVRLPSAWNQRFFFQGGGGTNGDVGEAIGLIAPGQPSALDRGYAVVSQDSGHSNSLNAGPDRGGVVAFGFDPQARADYGGASLKPVVQAATALIRTYYGRAPMHSYFVGCSKGGQEGMYLAQRNPELFDGIVAAAPGFSLPRAAVAEAWDTQAFATLLGERQERLDYQRLPSTFDDAQFGQVREAVLAACDADDGARDGISADWEACTWSRVKPELQRRVCANSPDCLTGEQVDVLARIFAGAKNGQGQSLYASWPFDGGIGSNAWRLWKIGTVRGMRESDGPFPGINVAMGAPALAAIFTTPPTALGPELSGAFDYAMKFDFDKDAQRIYAVDAPFTRSAWDDIGARSADLAAFRARGGKMIVPHGVSDPVFSINDTTTWYREVDKLNAGQAGDFVRVFAVPGMAHCAGGPATSNFDAFDALVEWVEQGAAPERIQAAAGPDTPWPNRTRPLCPYPKVARYDGVGNLESAGSFRCE